MKDHPGSLAIRALALCALLAPALPARAGSGDEIARELRSNQQALQDFTWKSRAEATLGKKTSVQLFEARYDMDGTVLATPVEPEEPAEPGRRGRPGREQPAPELLALVDGYTHLTPDTLKELFERATIGPGEGDDAPLTRVRAEGVITLGDRVELWVDRESGRPRRAEVVTSLDGKPVRIETRFSDLDAGPSFPSHTTVRTEVKSRPLVLEIENFGPALEGG